MTEVPAVGFTAYVSAGRRYSTNEPVIFDTILFNIGDAFDPISSIFTCPVTGVYVVTVSVASYSSGYAQVIIVKEGQKQTGVFADDVSGQISAASTSAVTACIAGERVWVESTAGATSIRANVDVRDTSFSVFLLNAA